MAAKDPKTLHIVMFPWLAFGHMIPFLELSKNIALKGHRISFVSTPRNIDRLPKIPSHLASLITLVKIPLPKLPELPENAEATTDIHVAQMDHLKKAFDGLEPGLTRFLEDSRPDWIIYDFVPYWLPPITARLGISGAFFFIVSAWFLAFYGPAEAMISGSDYRTKPEDFMVPPKWVKFDTKVVYRRFEAKWVVGSGQKNDSGFSDAYRGGKVILGTEAILLRDCYEIEPIWLTVLEELHQRPVIPVGLLPPKLEEADCPEEIWFPIKNWLDRQNKGSVVYVAFGSEATPSQDQLTELSHGLELSGVPFFWVLRKPLESPESLDLPDGFEERVSGRGIVWKSWVPQMKILSHESVGGFLTHSGWSSVVEALIFGHPLISLPFFGDQYLNSRVVTEKQFAIEVPRDDEDGSYTRNSVADTIKLVMLEEGGKKIRERAKEMSAFFGDTDLHGRYIDKLVEFMENHKYVNKDI